MDGSRYHFDWNLIVSKTMVEMYIGSTTAASGGMCRLALTCSHALTHAQTHTCIHTAGQYNKNSKPDMYVPV